MNGEQTITLLGTAFRVARNPRREVPAGLEWRSASAEAREAYRAWRRSRDADGYAVYRAAADRADAAQDAFARSATRS
jgi:hypothetical protein